MDYYLFRPDRQDRTARGRIRANLARSYSLPGVECPVCGETWFTTGVQYPAIDLLSLENHTAYSKSRAVDLREVEKLRQIVRPLVTDGWDLPPGTGFGALSGSIGGEYGPCCWVNLWTPLFSEQRVSVLNSREIGIVPAWVHFAHRPPHGDLYEPQILMGAYLTSGIREMEPCAGSGRRGFSRPKDRLLILDVASGP